MSRVDESAWGSGRVEADDVDHAGLRELLGSLDKVTAARPSNADYRAAWMACCPAHDDRKPSLSIGWRTNGRITIHCFRGCTRDAVIRAAGIDKALLAPPRNDEPEAVYEYRDESGALLYQKLRYPGKRMKYRRPDGSGGWIGKQGDKVALYMLPELITAQQSGELVVLPEGEKDVDRLRSIGFTATTTPGGANARWRDEFTKYFAGVDLVLLQDNDEAGEKYVKSIAHRLRDTAKTIRIVLLPGLPPKGDVSDWLDVGHTADELRAIMASAPIVAGTSTSARGDDAERNSYLEDEHGLWRIKGPNQPPIRLSNTAARIVRQVTEDNGVEQKVMLEIAARWSTKTGTLTVAPTELDEMKWLSRFDARASLTPRTSPHEVSYAIKLFSRDIAEETIYTHTGWHVMSDGQAVYLHGGGAIGADGPIRNLSVRLDGSLEPMRLPDPPEGDALRRAILATLAILDVAPDRITIPLLAAAFRSTLGPSRLSIHYLGQTGAGKTKLLGIIQQFFGAEFGPERLIAHWIATANAIEGMLFQAKDMVVTIDDFNPRGAQGDVQRAHQHADRVFRAAGNLAARGRLKADLSERPSRPPRGKIVSSGEEAPTGHSLTARILLIEVGKCDIKFDGPLSEVQANGREGRYAECMSAFLRFHAGEYHEFAKAQAEMLAELRRRASVAGAHRRTPDATANMMLGWLRFLDFAHASEAISLDVRSQLEKRGWAAFDELARQQLVYQAQENQARLLVALIRDAVRGEKAHVSDFSGEVPRDWANCGWHVESAGDRVSYRPHGPRVGYVDENGDVFLIKSVAYSVAQELSRNAPHGITVKIDTLSKRLAEAGLLKGTEERDGKHYRSVRNRKGGKYEILWWFDRSVFEFYDEPEASTTPSDEEEDAF